MQQLASQILVNIIDRQMKMPEGRVWVRDQNKKIPPDNGLFIVVGMTDSYVMSSTARMEQVETPNEDPEEPPIITQNEISYVQMCENIQIDVLSRSNDALTRNWEVVAALKSFYSQQMQEANYFKIFRIPRGFVNSSVAEGGSQLNRYSLSFPVFVWYRKDVILTDDGGNYFDAFGTRVDDEETIGTEDGLIEFNLPAEENP